MLAISTHGKGLYIWDSKQDKLTQIWTGDGNLDTLRAFIAWSLDGRKLATDSGRDVVLIWSIENGDFYEIKTQNRGARSATWSPDGSRLALAEEAEIIIRDADNGNQLQVLTGHNNIISVVAWSPDGRLLASGSLDDNLRIWDVESGKTLQVLNGHNTTDVYSLAWSPNGSRLASGGQDGSVVIWDINGKQLQRLEGQSYYVRGLAWSPDGIMLATGANADIQGRTGSLIIWDTSEGKQLQSLDGDFSGVTSVAWSPNGTTLASAGGNATDAFNRERAIRIWKISGK